MRARVSLVGTAVVALGCGSREPEGTARAALADSSRPPAAPAASALREADPKPVLSPPDVRPRVYAKTRFVWIRPEPNEASGWVGFLWFGGSAALREPAPKVGPGCTKWYAVEPRGWVCADGERATLDANDPALVKLRPYAPDVGSAWPHKYGESRGLYRYPGLPKHGEQRLREWDLPEHLKAIEQARAGGKLDSSLAGVDLTPATGKPIDLTGLPPTVREARHRLTPLSTVAYSAEVEDGGRSWLLSADLLWVPKDRVAPYPKVTFAGVHLGRDGRLPLAFFRTKDRPKFRRDSDGTLVESEARWPRLSHVELTGEREEQRGETFLETRDAGFWVKKSDAVLPIPQDKTPWGAPVDGPDTTEGPSGRRTWLEASVWQGWLIAYEGTKPVFATLIAPGRGGTPERGKDPIETASTPVGTFPITGKFATATMVAPGEFIHSDVPWAQNFHGPHALHGAYWHDDWGNRKSGGCVNVSPLDGKFLFEFTEPPIPDGWHGVRWRPTQEPATQFVVHE